MTTNAVTSVVLGEVALIGGKVTAGIRCFGDGGGVLDIGFVQDGKPLPAAITDPIPTLFQHRSDMASFIDLLRNEGPIFMVIDAKNPQRHRLRTGREPVGSGE